MWAVERRVGTCLLSNIYTPELYSRKRAVLFSSHLVRPRSAVVYIGPPHLRQRVHVRETGAGSSNVTRNQEQRRSMRCQPVSFCILLLSFACFAVRIVIVCIKKVTCYLFYPSRVHFLLAKGGTHLLSWFFEHLCWNWNNRRMNHLYSIQPRRK